MLQSPTGWDGPEPAADDQQRLFDAIAEDLDRRLLELAARRLKSERLTDWRDAYNESGPGATFRRAQHIADQVHALGAPLPGAMASPGRNLLLKEVAAAMQATLESAGARLN
jgi:RES domain-containing protein